MKQDQILTIPNALTLLRILLVPVFIYLYLNEQRFVGAMIILICGVSDFLDGFIARHYDQVSELGKAMDPVADKLLQFAIVFVLVFTVNHMIYLFLLFLIKEASMLICWLLLKKKGGYMNGALWFGKISTAVFYIAMFALIALPLHNTLAESALMLITAFFLALSFILYIKTYIAMFRDLTL